MLQPFAKDVWIADGPPVSAFGPITLPTRMIVVRLSDGVLWINSPVESSPELLDQVRAVGPVRYLVAPTPLHVWRLHAWRELFLDAKAWGPPRARSSNNLAFDGILGDVSPAEWSSDIDQLVLRGNVFLDEVEFLHKPSRTLMVTDFIQNYPIIGGDALGNLAKRIGGVLNGGVPRDIRWSFTDRGKAREALEKLLSWDFDKVILAHGACVDHNAKDFVEAAFRWLLA